MLWRRLMGAGMACFLSAFALAPRLEAQETPSAAPVQMQHPWLLPTLLEQARSEGSLTVYSSINEGEALPLWKVFETATGLKVNYVRGSDTMLLGRIAIEQRARQPSWDMIITTAVTKLPRAFLAQINPPEGQNIMPEARDPEGRWYGMYSNYNAPAYNTDHVKASNLPATYDGFLDHTEWAGHVAINQTDDEWLGALFAHYGDTHARQLIKSLVMTLKPVLLDGHLALARAVGVGEYWIALNNFVNLTINVKLSGAPIDYWGLDSIALSFGQIGVNAHAAHPKAALLAANFLLSKEGQAILTRRGRIPVRRDIPPNPTNAVTQLGGGTIAVENFTRTEGKKWSTLYQELFRPR